MEKIKELMKKLLTKEVILYIVFGITTTIVNLVVFYVLDSILHWNENVANILAIIAAVLVAYITNRDLVFHSEARGFKERFIEFWKFIAGRGATMLLEWILGVLLFLLPIPKIISKMVVTVIVIIANFFISKFFTFRKKK